MKNKSIVSILFPLLMFLCFISCSSPNKNDLALDDFEQLVNELEERSKNNQIDDEYTLNFYNRFESFEKELSDSLNMTNDQIKRLNDLHRRLFVVLAPMLEQFLSGSNDVLEESLNEIDEFASSLPSDFDDTTSVLTDDDMIFEYSE